MVAGGGGGGGNHGGGGGAGGVVVSDVPLSAGSYSVAVGNGGAGTGANPPHPKIDTQDRTVYLVTFVLLVVVLEHTQIHPTGMVLTVDQVAEMLLEEVEVEHHPRDMDLQTKYPIYSPTPTPLQNQPVTPTPQGNPGGTQTGSGSQDYGGGGGGGAGSAGQDQSATGGGDGGNGVQAPPIFRDPSNTFWKSCS